MGNETTEAILGTLDLGSTAVSRTSWATLADAVASGAWHVVRSYPTAFTLSTSVLAGAGVGYAVHMAGKREEARAARRARAQEEIDRAGALKTKLLESWRELGRPADPNAGPMDPFQSDDVQEYQPICICEDKDQILRYYSDNRRTIIAAHSLGSAPNISTALTSMLNQSINDHASAFDDYISKYKTWLEDGKKSSDQVLLDIASLRLVASSLQLGITSPDSFKAVASTLYHQRPGVWDGWTRESAVREVDQHTAAIVHAFATGNHPDNAEWLNKLMPLTGARVQQRLTESA